MNLELLVIGSKNFNSTIEEIKDNLEYSILFFDFNEPLSNISPLIAGVLVDSNIYNNKINLDFINKFKNKPILFLQNPNINHQNNFENRRILPDLSDLLPNKILQSKLEPEKWCKWK